MSLLPCNSGITAKMDGITKGVANGSSKTLGLAKCYSNLTGLAVSFFKRLCASRSLVLNTKDSRSLDFLQG